MLGKEGGGERVGLWGVRPCRAGGKGGMESRGRGDEDDLMLENRSPGLLGGDREGGATARLLNRPCRPCRHNMAVVGNGDNIDNVLENTCILIMLAVL